MKIFNYGISLAHFERLLLSGNLVEKASAKHQHRVEVTEITFHDAKGCHRNPQNLPTKLNPGESLHRRLKCEKADQFPQFGLDKFFHDEHTTKQENGTLRVSDVLSFHDGVSKAERSYNACATPNGMRREVRDWSVDMAGLGLAYRLFVNEAMKHALPKTELEMAEILKTEAGNGDRAA